jgi:hypothetical protein
MVLNVFRVYKIEKTDRENGNFVKFEYYVTDRLNNRIATGQRAHNYVLTDNILEESKALALGVPVNSLIQTGREVILLPINSRSDVLTLGRKKVVVGSKLPDRSTIKELSRIVNEADPRNYDQIEEYICSQYFSE